MDEVNPSIAEVKLKAWIVAIYVTGLVSCKSAFCKRWEKVKGEGENTKPFPLSPAPYPLLATPPSPFPDFCKKSIVIGHSYSPCSPEFKEINSMIDSSSLVTQFEVQS